MWFKHDMTTSSLLGTVSYSSSYTVIVTFVKIT